VRKDSLVKQKLLKEVKMQETNTLSLNQTFGQIADQDTINKTIEALKANGFDAAFVKTSTEARAALLSEIPEGSVVFNATSETLTTIGVDTEINESGKYKATRGILYDPKSSLEEKKRAGYIVEYAVGSVHALTQDGHALIASRSGSQMPAYVFGADHVIWVVGAQKIVKDTEEGLKRIYEYAFPLENQRALKAYGFESSVNNILIMNKQDKPRVKVIVVGEKLGF